MTSSRRTTPPTTATRASSLVLPTLPTSCGATLQKLQKAERAKGGVLDMETEIVSGLTAYGPGYIDPELKDLEKVVGLQTDKPLKRAFMPYGGIKMAEQACTTYGYQPSREAARDFHQVPQDPQPGRVRCLHPRDARRPATATSSPACPTPMAAAVSSATTAAWRCTASTTSSKAKQNDFANCGDGTMTEDGRPPARGDL